MQATRMTFVYGLLTGLIVAMAVSIGIRIGVGGGMTPDPPRDWLPDSDAAAIASIEGQLRGMDVTMWEIGYRFNELYFAGEDRNWDYADYQLEKIETALRLAIERRPARAGSAAHFLNEVLPEVNAIAAERTPKSHVTAMDRLRAGCMMCHALEDVPYFTVNYPRIRATSILPLPEEPDLVWPDDFALPESEEVEETSDTPEESPAY